jgi:hypothetical protein
MKILGPIDIAAAAPFTIGPPPKEIMHDYDKVVVNNHSPYLLKLFNGAFQGWCHPFMGDLFPYDPSGDGKIYAEPELMGTLAGNPHHFCVEYYEKDEQVSGKSYPAMMAQFGSTLVDSPELLDTISASQVPFTGTMVDVTAFQSFQLLVQYEAANAGPPANTCIMQISWWDAAEVNEIWRQTYELNSINSTDCGPTRIVDAMHGEKMQISFIAGNGAASTASYLLWGSNRSVDTPRVEEFGDVDARGLGTDRALLQTTTLSVGGGATVRRNVRLGSGFAVFMFGGGATSTSYDVLLHSPEQGSGNRVYSANFTGTPAVVQTLALPRRALTFVVINNDAGAKNVFFSLIQAQDG